MLRRGLKYTFNLLLGGFTALGSKLAFAAVGDTTSSSVLGSASGIGQTLGDAFISLSSEYPALLNSIEVLMAGTGIVIASSAVVDVMKTGRRDSGSGGAGTGAIFAKMLGGSALIDIAFWANVWTSSLWSLDDPAGIGSYAASGGSDNWHTAFMAVIGFIVLSGYVVLGRAYLMVTKLGYLSPDARSDLIGNIIARIFAGSLMVAALHVSEAFDTSMGLNWVS